MRVLGPPRGRGRPERFAQKEGSQVEAFRSAASAPDADEREGREEAPPQRGSQIHRPRSAVEVGGGGEDEGGGEDVEEESAAEVQERH
mmetsp:Transcript_13861/g.10001  ORF Transcript_13861/g.10001 Transcript_13861/m.10001 type:complete len:88 (+) Transcript_13861:217-480(+)